MPVNIYKLHKQCNLKCEIKFQHSNIVPSNHCPGPEQRLSNGLSLPGMLLQVAHESSQVPLGGPRPLAMAALCWIQAVQGQGQRHIGVEELLKSSDWDGGSKIY